ncbi:MAG: alpha-L-fucosidase [Candidatus Epulonipiscioides saccharophilum]|nr:MAG: alpha-L-fucosidase [Epulopiscium sp. AS2M-Bin001]
MNQYFQNMKNYLKTIDEVIANGPHKDTWESLANHKVPDWYRNAKFGIFIHWGVYAVPAYNNEWYPRAVYKQNPLHPGQDVFSHHVEKYGPHKDFGYKDFVPMFKAEKFDAAEWADLFKQAGARFVMPVAEHHDGFQMYDSNLSDWCAAKKGPMKDIVGLLKQECEKRDIVLTTSSHRIEHYWFMCGGRDFDSDFQKYLDKDGNFEYGDMYWPSYPEPFVTTSGDATTDLGSIHVDGIDPIFMEDWLVRTCELADKYQPQIMYFDWWIQIEPMKPYLRKFAAYYYNRAIEWGKEVTINYKNDAFQHTSAVRDIERGQLSDVSPFFWQNDTSVAKNSWCYTENNDYKQSFEVICDLVDVVSKNGSLLLNIGPKADGTIPEQDTKILQDVGAWLKVNGEAIYDSFPFRKYGEGPIVTEEGHFTDTKRKSFTTEDFRFTYKPNSMYVFAMKWPEDGVLKIKTFGSKVKKFNANITNAQVLGCDAPCEFIECAEHLTIISKHKVENPNLPVCVKLTID